MPDTVIDLVRGLPLLQGTDPSLAESVAGHAELLRLGPREILFEAGAVLPVVYVILRGHVQILLPRRHGAVGVGLAGPNEIPGCAAALLRRASLSMARTATSAHLLAMEADFIRELCGKSADFAGRLLGEVLQELDRSTIDLNAQRAMSIDQRLAFYLAGKIEDTNKRPARLILDLEKQLLAERIGASKENLSRAFGRLRQFGVISRGRTVVVSDPAALWDYAELEAPPQPDTPPRNE